MLVSKKKFIIIGSTILLLCLIAIILIVALKKNKLKTPGPIEKEISVPFTSQAPEGNWQEPWQNACEEASIVMIQNFYKDEGLTVEKARA